MSRLSAGPLMGVLLLAASSAWPPASLVARAVQPAQRGQAPGSEEPTFRGTTDTVSVFATVTDGSGRALTGLDREAFRVLDNGKPQPVLVFDNSAQPVRLTVLIDVSGSMAGNLRLLRGATQSLIARLGRDDTARIGTFGKDVRIAPGFTRDEAMLLRDVPTAIEPDAPTPLWRAIDAALDAPAPGTGRRVILVLSDGKDSGPQFRARYVSQVDVMDRAQREDVMIYAVGLRSRGAGGMPMGPNIGAALAAEMPDPGLARLAIESGGGYAELRARDDLGEAFARILDELHQQYLLGFAPPARDGKVHKLDVRVSTRDAKVRARRSYRAASASN